MECLLSKWRKVGLASPSQLVQAEAPGSPTYSLAQGEAARCRAGPFASVFSPPHVRSSESQSILFLI